MKVIIEASALSMSELHTLVPVFNVGTPILSVLFSLTYDQKHFGFSTRLLPMILLISARLQCIKPLAPLS